MLAIVLCLVPLAAGQMLLGAPTSVNVDRDDVQKMASFALSELNTLLGAQNTLVKIEAAETQVVAGTNYMLALKLQQGSAIRYCNVTVWSRPWLHDNRMTHHWCSSNKRQIMAGGPMVVDVNRDDIQQMAAFAMGELNTLLGSQNSLLKVVSAKTQVVAGINYILSLQVQQNGASKICNVTIWSRPWLNDQRITHHKCSSNKRQVMTGGPMTTNIHRADIQEMANFALSEINQLTGVKNTLDEVIAAKTQVVAGINYILTIRIKEGTNTQTCHVTIFYQAWTSTKQLSKHTCSASRRRNIGMPGGLTTVDVNSAEIQQMANLALTQINGIQGTQNSLDQIISAKTQVVAGINYILALRLKKDGETQICNVKIWSQPWMNKQQMTEHHCSKMTKRAGPLLGGATHADINSPDVQKMAVYTVTTLNGLQHEQNSLVKVLSARKQVVAGMNYFLKLSLQNGGKTQICDVEIWYQAWTDTKTLLSHHCTAGAVSKRSILGGVQPGTLSEPVQKAVGFAEDALNAKSNSLFRMVTETVDHITRQLVSGIKYTFDLHLVTSSCTNGDDSVGKSLKQCPANTNNAQRQTCRVSVMFQAWSDPKFRMVSDNCGDLS